MNGTGNGIVAGYDGSDGADQALRWAVREAQHRGAILTVCLAWAPEYLAALGEASVYDLAQHKGEEILARGAEYAESMLDEGMVKRVLARGPAARVLCEHSETAELVVIGSRGRGGVEGLQVGSVAWEVAIHGRGPVVTVRGEWQVADHPPRYIVVGLDESPASPAALAFAFTEAQLRSVPLVAVCALADAAGVLGEARELEEDFNRTLARWEKDHPDATVIRQVAPGSPRTELLDAASQAQLLVVGCRGRGGVCGMNLGSVAGAVLNYAPCPVAIMHSPADSDHGNPAADGWS